MTPALRHNDPMLGSWLRRLVRAEPVIVEDALWRATIAALPFLARLTSAENARLRDLAGCFLAEKEMAAAGGLVLDAPMQVSIAAQACLPILNLGLPWYSGWTGIVVYPDEFVVPREITDDAGVVHRYDESIAGEAWDGGPLLLSWADAQRHGPGDAAYNVVIHEFTHKLDMVNGDADGVPPFDRKLHPQLNTRTWCRVLDDAFERFGAELDLIENELPAQIDPDSDAADPYYARLPLDAYAAKDKAEFFAVSSEAFFVAPERLAAAFPAWYAQLAAFFLQDPLRPSDR
jgi:hypothetical protein